MGSNVDEIISADAKTGQNGAQRTTGGSVSAVTVSGKKDRSLCSTVPTRLPLEDTAPSPLKAPPRALHKT